MEDSANPCPSKDAQESKVDKDKSNQSIDLGSESDQDSRFDSEDEQMSLSDELLNDAQKLVSLKNECH